MLVLCLTQEEDAVFCFGELTFPRYHFKLFHSPTFIYWLFFPSHRFVAPLPFFSFSCSLHLLCVLLFQTHFPIPLYIPPYLNPFIFSHSLFHQSDPLSYASSHSPAIVLILGCLSYFAPISRSLSPPLLHYSPLPISPLIPVFLVSG